MTLTDVLNVPVPIGTKTYKPISHNEIISTTINHLNNHNYDYKLSFNAANAGQIIVGTFKIGEGDFSRSLSFINSYNKTRKVGFAGGTVTQVCQNGMLWGDNIFYKKHVGNVRDELSEMIQKELNTIEITYKEVINWFDNLKLQQLSKKEMSELAGRMFIEEEILTATQLSELKRQILKPEFDYGGNNNTMYELYQHCTHSIKSTHPSKVFGTNKRLINFVKEIV